MRILRRGWAVIGVIVAAWAVLLAGSLQARASAAVDVPSGPLGCQSSWEMVPFPPFGEILSMHGADATGPNDVWSAGYYIEGGFERTVIVHWNGTEWVHTPSPNPGPFSKLNSFASVAPNDAWAIGSYGSSNSFGSTMFFHWDGSSWTHAPAPNPSAFQGLTSADAIGSDVWAVGLQVNPGESERTLVMRLVGGVWTVVPSPNVDGATQNRLLGISGSASNDIWAVGYSTQNGVQSPLTMHWDGSSWTIVPSPTPGNTRRLYAAAAVAPNDAWAMGSLDGPAGHQTMIMHWDGLQWSVVPSPNLRNYNELWGAYARASNDVWAVGFSIGTGNSFIPVALHWDGTSWKDTGAVYDPDVSKQYHFHTLVALGPGEAIGVGELGVGTMLHYRPSCGTTETPTPGASATNTPNPTSTETGVPTKTIVPTNTPTVPLPTNTRTATAVPTACSVSFTDVPPNDAFYPYVMCLACRSVLSGYADGTFRPFNSVTRGQIAKIVAIAAGLPGEAGAQVFEDVPPSSPFYLWVNLLAAEGHMSGYTCGGPGEPCGVGNRPYFRPFANATRGQMSKIVANAAGLGGDPTEQTFADVPSTHTFYLWIQRLASLEIMSGYGCGGPGEPCDPLNQPYFRPFNDVTRGQSSKITANTFFPTCQPSAGHERSGG